jgi:hypothetical protein
MMAVASRERGGMTYSTEPELRLGIMGANIKDAITKAKSMVTVDMCGPIKANILATGKAIQ